MLARQRNAILIGIGCVVVAALYGGLAPVFNYKVETMLIALGAAMGMMVAVLSAGREE